MTAGTSAEKSLLVLLHAFGSSRDAWRDITPHVAEDFEVFAPDLPGFGDAAGLGARSIEETAHDLASRISAQAGPAGWFVVGHSMGGKFATILASGAVGGLPAPRGVLLLAGSPPSPEPMAEDRREEMIGWAADGRIDEAEALRFITANIGAPLSAEAEQSAIADITASSAQAWTAWLETGTREDWSGRVGKLPMPCEILVGSKDGDLGAAGQKATNMLVYGEADLSVEDGCGHLLPLERPAAVVAALRRLQRRTAAAVASGETPASAAARSA